MEAAQSLEVDRSVIMSQDGHSCSFLLGGGAAEQRQPQTQVEPERPEIWVDLFVRADESPSKHSSCCKFTGLPKAIVACSRDMPDGTLQAAPLGPTQGNSEFGAHEGTSLVPWHSGGASRSSAGDCFVALCRSSARDGLQ